MLMHGFDLVAFLDPLRIEFPLPTKSFAITFAIFSIFSIALGLPSKSDPEFVIKDEKIASKKNSPATKADTFLYRQIGINYLCRARLADIEFRKALGISAATFADIITQKHGGYVSELPDQKLSPKQLYLSGEVQLVEGSIKFCPEQVPEDAKKKFKEFLKKDKENKKSNKK